jgi:hypothetical protein
MIMFNTIAAYIEAGEKAGIASKELDWSRCQSWFDHARKMWHLETADNRKLARKAFEDAYRAKASRITLRA